MNLKIFLRSAEIVIIVEDENCANLLLLKHSYFLFVDNINLTNNLAHTV